MTRIFLIALVTCSLPAIAEDKYKGRLEGQNASYVTEKEADLASSLKSATADCELAFTASVDWGSFPNEWSNTWHPGSVVGTCKQLVDAVRLACGDGHRKKLRAVKEIVCGYDKDLPLRFKSEDRFEPSLKIEGGLFKVGFDERETMTSFDTPVKNFLDSKYVRPPEPPKAEDARYMGRVPKQYFKMDMMEDAERDLASALKNAEDNCKQRFEWSIDWKTYDDDWSNTWNPIGMTGYCKQAISGINGACYSKYKKGLAKVKKIRCHYVDALKLKAREGSMSNSYAPKLEIKGDTLHIGYTAEEMGNFEPPIAEFLGKPGRGEPRKKPKRRR